MNKTMCERMEAIGNRNRLCLKGKINTDINSRLPEKPPELSAWEKYKLIRDGEAKIKKNLTVKTMMQSSSYNQQSLVNSFTYPQSDDWIAYDKAKKATSNELETRELAVDLAINRLVDEVCSDIIDSKTFLNNMEILASKEW